MAKKAIDAVIEIDNWRANFEKLENGKFNQRYFGAYTYRRTRFSVDYTGQSILNTLQNQTLNLMEINTTPLKKDLKDFLLKKSRTSEGNNKLFE